KGDILLVQIYVDDIIFGATNKDLCKSFGKLMKDKFQMSSMEELTFFLGLQDPDGEDVDVHTYRSMIGSLMYLTSSKPDIMFAPTQTVTMLVQAWTEYLQLKDVNSLDADWSLGSAKSKQLLPLHPQRLNT
nr:hypothetical protein [Tanacetum cinerariifolium]